MTEAELVDKRCRISPAESARTRYVEELLQRPELLRWIGESDARELLVDAPPEVTRELLFRMPAGEFAALLRAAGMPALAQRFELGESFARLYGLSRLARELAGALSFASDLACTAAHALAAALLLAGVERTPRERYGHRLWRRRRARLLYGRSRGRRRR